MVWVTDAQGLVSQDSPAWRAFTGQTREEVDAFIAAWRGIARGRA